MAGFIELMERSRISVTSADGAVEAIMAGGRTMEFKPKRSFARYTESQLADQFADLIGRVFAARTKARLTALSHVVDEDVTPLAEYELNAKERRFRQLRDEITVVGSAPDRSVRIKQTGPAGWQVRIEPGTVTSRSETEILSALQSALSDVMKKFRFEVGQARVTVYGDADLKRYR